MNTLDSIESSQRSRYKERARQDQLVHGLAASAVAFIVTPFFVTSFLFIPFLGQVLPLLALALSLLYFHARRSWKLTLCSTLGCGISFAALSIASQAFLTSAPLGAYVLMGLSVAVSISYIIGISGALWRFYERGAASI